MSEPQPHQQVAAPESQPGVDRQRRVEALAEEYLEGLLAGQTPDRQAFLAAHADLADLLEPRLALVELMHRVARGQRPAGSPTTSLAPPGEHVLRIRCPHCGNGIQVVEPAAGEVTCGGCGSSFHLDLRSTMPYNPAALPQTIGKFEVLEQLGRGAFGTVYKARDPELQRLVAIKVPRAGSFATSEEEERFLREARAAAQLSHPGIVPVLEIAHDRGLPYIVSEYVEGLTLADVLTGRRPTFREAAELVAAVADALDYAHRQKVVHRDIKPSNLLIDAAGRPHVTDFGLARRGEGEITVTLDGQILGTPAYMSPEQAAGDQQHVDARSDVYSLGVLLYELLAGELPFRGNQRMLLHQVLNDDPRPPRSLNDRVPRDLETICLKAMAKVPGRRYASAQEMADDLRRFLNGESIRARPVGRTERLARWARRNPAVASLTALVILLLATVAAGALGVALFQQEVNHNLSVAKEAAERSQREAELRAASAAVDLDLKHCTDGEIDYGVLRLARTLRELPPHATELRQCVQMNLLAWAQEIRPLGPTFQYDGSEHTWTAWELSPDGRTVLTGGEDGTARLWDAVTGEVRATLRGHRRKIDSVGFSPDGRVAMTVHEDRVVRLWDAASGQARTSTPPQPNSIARALLSPDARRLLTLSHENPDKLYDSMGSPVGRANDRSALILRDTATGERVAELVGHSGLVNDAVFSPDGRLVLTGGMDKTARLWSAENGRALATLGGHAGAVIAVAFSPDGEVAGTLAPADQNATPSQSLSVRWWDAGRAAPIGPPCTSPDGRHVGGFRLIRRDVAVMYRLTAMDTTATNFFVQGSEHAIAASGDPESGRADDESLFDSSGTAYDRRLGSRRDALAGRKFPGGLEQFAAAGRFLLLGTEMAGVVDLVCEKPVGQATYWGRTRYLSDRQTFVVLTWPSPQYIPLPGAPLDAETARLFAEVATCRELDGATARPLDERAWDERCRELARRLESAAPPPVRRLAADPWYWLRRQLDGKVTDDDWRMYLDRLIAGEPTWQNYHSRAEDRWWRSKDYTGAARDLLEAARRAGSGFWHSSASFFVLLGNVVEPSTGTPEQYQMGLQLAEALTRAKPEDRDCRIGLAIAHYRLGHYPEALSALELWQREREQEIVSRMGQVFMTPLAVAFPHSEKTGPDIIKARAFLAMAHHRLGHAGQARALLADLRRMGDGPDHRDTLVKWSYDYTHLLREAESLIEGRSDPEK
jgi:hypothetical protein